MINDNLDNPKQKLYLLQNKHHLPIHRRVRQRKLIEKQISNDNKCNCILTSIFCILASCVLGITVLIDNYNNNTNST